MNITTFNRTLPMHLITAMKEEWDDPFKSPLFVWDDITDEEAREIVYAPINDKLEAGEIVLPFPEMRLYINANKLDRDNGARGWKCWVRYNPRVSAIRAYFQRDPVEPTEKGYIDVNEIITELTFSLQIMEEFAREHPDQIDAKIQSDNLGLRNACMMGHFTSHGQVDIKNPNCPPELTEALTSVANGCGKSLAAFAADIMNPGNFRARKIPFKQGKSQEWRESRTHWVLIDKDHPANAHHAVAGTEITDDLKAHRMAHSRRAHTRTLRHPRFKNARGKTIQVKAAWIGPSTWTDRGSIYVIQKPINPENA